MKNKWDMTQLGIILTKAIRARADVETQTEMAKRMGINGATLSNLKSDQRANPELLLKLVRGFSDDPPLQAELIEAQILDHVPSDLHQCLKVNINVAGISRQVVGSTHDELEATVAAIPPALRADVLAILKRILRVEQGRKRTRR